MAERDAIRTTRALCEDRCVTRAALRAAGLSDASILGLRRREHLHTVFPGVYVAGAPELTGRELLRAAILHAGPTAGADGRTGLELRALLPADPSVASIVTTRHNLVSPVRSLLPLSNGIHPRVEIRRSSPGLLLPTETVTGFSTTLLPRTLVDTAARHGLGVLRRAWREAEFQCLLDADAIRAELADGHRRAGSPLVRRLLDEHAPVTRPGMDVRSRSGELRFLRLVREAGLPAPEVNVRLTFGTTSLRVDFLWRAIGLVVEIDGPLHQLPAHAAEDRARDRLLRSHGLSVRRFSVEALRHERTATVTTLLALHDRLSR